MKISPFDDSPTDSWLYESLLYGRAGPRGGDSYTYEVYPAKPDEDVSDCRRIPRNKVDYEPEADEFDILEANTSTEYVSVITTHDRPSIRWYSQNQFESRFGYDPLDPPRPRGVDKRKWKKLAEKRVQGRSEPTLQLTEDRTKCLKRIAKLWNGEVVCGEHLLADSCPSIKRLTADLDVGSLKRLYYDSEITYDIEDSREFLLAFRGADWFDSTTGFLKPTHLLRKQIWYDLAPKVRLLINNKKMFPNLIGDPYEGVVHRVTVGLVRLYDAIHGIRSDSYYNMDGYVLDVFGRDSRQGIVREIMTAHNNWKLYRQTYRKMAELNQRGIKPIAIFDSRDTAYTVFNHWVRHGLAELPNGTFDSEYSISLGRERVQDAYENSELEWEVADWSTTWKLKQKTLGPSGPELSRDDIISLDW